MRIQERFAALASRVACWAGHPAACALAASIIVGWVLLGPKYHYSDTWQLVINTGTTIVTFLMVFLIQNTQNREATATQIKLDELIRSVRGAHNVLLDLEDLTPQQLARVRARYARLAREARRAMRHGLPDTGSPDVLHRRSHPSRPKNGRGPRV